MNLKDFVLENQKIIELVKDRVGGKTDVESIKSKTGSLTEASMKLGEAIYKAQQPEQKPEEAQPQENADDKKEDVVDADFEEVKDKKEEK